MNLKRPGASVPLGEGIMRPFRAICPRDMTTRKEEAHLPNPVPAPQPAYYSLSHLPAPRPSLSNQG